MHARINYVGKVVNFNFFIILLHITVGHWIY